MIGAAIIDATRGARKHSSRSLRLGRCITPRLRWGEEKPAGLNRSGQEEGLLRSCCGRLIACLGGQTPRAISQARRWPRSRLQLLRLAVHSAEYGETASPFAAARSVNVHPGGWWADHPGARRAMATRGSPSPRFRRVNRWHGSPPVAPAVRVPTDSAKDPSSPGENYGMQPRAESDFL